jgi:hypothetical protein
LILRAVNLSFVSLNKATVSVSGRRQLSVR